MWVLIPTMRQATGLNFHVLFSAIALLGNRDQSRINDLTTTGFEALFSEESLKLLEELFDDACFAKTFPEESHSCGVWNIVHHPKTYELLKRSPVIDLEFKFFIAQVEKLLEHQHLEQDQRINPLATSIALALLHVTHLKQWTE